MPRRTRAAKQVEIVPTQKQDGVVLAGCAIHDTGPTASVADHDCCHSGVCSVNTSVFANQYRIGGTPTISDWVEETLVLLMLLFSFGLAYLVIQPKNLYKTPLGQFVNKWHPFASNHKE